MMKRRRTVRYSHTYVCTVPSLPRCYESLLCYENSKSMLGLVTRAHVKTACEGGRGVCVCVNSGFFEHDIIHELQWKVN